jgi:Rv0078B-related antitoxin
MRCAFDLFAAGLDLQRQNLRRRHPGATEDEIDALLDAWLEQRPGAEHGDGEGRPASRFPQMA